MLCVETAGKDDVAAGPGARLGIIGVDIIVKVKLDASAAALDSFDESRKGMALITVIGVQHPLNAALPKHREILIPIDRGCRKDVFGEPFARFNIPHQQVDAKPL